MKKFSTRVLLFLLPLLVITCLLEFSIRQTPNDYSSKRNYLDANSNNVETVFLGSSHAYYGVNPKFIEGVAFNASHVSQSIDYDYAILKRYENNWEKLEYIVLPIDYQTMFSRLSTGIEPWRKKDYQLYYDIGDEVSIVGYSKFLSLGLRTAWGRIYAYYFSGLPYFACSESGFGRRKLKSKDLEATGIEASERHTVEDKSIFEENTKILQDIIEFAAKNNVKILFYTSPAYTTYVSNLDKNQLEMATKLINGIVKNNSNLYYYNLLEDTAFGEEDYSDSDHLNEIGAEKLSIKLNDILNEVK